MISDTLVIIIIFIINLIIAAVIGAITASITIGRYKEKVDNLIQEKDKACTKIEKLRSDVDKLLEFKVNAQKFIDSKIYKTGSRLTLTEFGKTLLRESGFDDIFEREKDNLARKLSVYPNKTKYDIQENARSLMDSLVDYEPFASIKTYAFNKGIDFGQILRAGAIPLRDYYLGTHPEIKE
ncbi:hypothetical protein KJA15_02940 [Patescibacteria group bacterium]|nr:hypothetical protein [Patescibacteria group bacterium]